MDGAASQALISQWVIGCLFLAAITSPNVSAADGSELRTDHFLLYVETLDAADTARLLEAGYGQLKEFFNSVEPDRKLQVKIFATKERYQAAFDKLRKVFYWNKKHRNVDGLYARETATAYLWVHPNEYVMRRLLLHELAHQYHDFIRSWAYKPSLDYCDEGLAEYLAWHNWDGKALQLGVAPQFAPMDYAVSALQQMRSTGFEFERVIYGDADIDYALAWGLVSFLIAEHPKEFHIWRTGLNHGVDPDVAWQKRFGAVTPQFIESFQQWLTAHSQPWQVVSGDWQPWGAEIEGRSAEDRPAQVTLVKDPAAFTADFHPTSNCVQGVIFGFLGGRNFFVLERQKDKWEIANLVGGDGNRGKRQTFPAVASEASITIEPGAAGTLLKFDGHSVDMTNVTGRVGLWVERGKGSFRCTWKPNKKGVD